MNYRHIHVAASGGTSTIIGTAEAGKLFSVHESGLVVGHYWSRSLFCGRWVRRAVECVPQDCVVVSPHPRGKRPIESKSEVFDAVECHVCGGPVGCGEGNSVARIVAANSDDHVGSARDTCVPHFDDSVACF